MPQYFDGEKVDVVDVDGSRQAGVVTRGNRPGARGRAGQLRMRTTSHGDLPINTEFWVSVQDVSGHVPPSRRL